MLDGIAGKCKSFLSSPFTNIANTIVVKTGANPDMLTILLRHAVAEADSVQSAIEELTKHLCVISGFKQHDRHSVDQCRKKIASHLVKDGCRVAVLHECLLEIRAVIAWEPCISPRFRILCYLNIFLKRPMLKALKMLLEQI